MVQGARQESFAFCHTRSRLKRNIGGVIRSVGDVRNASSRHSSRAKMRLLDVRMSTGHIFGLVVHVMFRPTQFVQGAGQSP